MDELVFTLLKNKQYEQASTKAAECIERVIATQDIATLDALSRSLKVLSIKLLDEEKDDIVNFILSKYLSLRGVSEQLRTRHLNQLGVGEGLKRMIYRMNFRFASKIVETFGFIEDKSVFNFFFTELVRNGEYKLALKWIAEKNDPSFYTADKLAMYLIKHGYNEAALKIIKDLNLYNPTGESQNTFDVPLLILQIMKKGSVRDGLMYLKRFKLKDDADLENKICPQFSEPIVVKSLLQALEWAYALSYIEKSKSKDILSQMFPIRSMLKLMMRRKDWAALTTFLKKDQFKSELEDKDNEEKDSFKKSLVQSLLDDEEVAQAVHYALEFNVVESFPMKDLVDKLIRRHEFGRLNKLVRLNNLSKELAEAKKEIQITKILALKHFRRRYGVTPAVSKHPGRKIVTSKLPFQVMSLKVKAQLAPFQDDKFLIHTENGFFRYLKDSNSNVELCQNATEPFAPRVSPRLQQFVERKLQAQKTNFNAHAEEWSPDMSKNSARVSPQPFPVMQRHEQMHERVSDKLHRAMGAQNNMSVPPGLSYHRTEHELHRHNSTGGMSHRQPSFHDFQRQSSFSRTTSPMNTHGLQNHSQSMDSYDMRARIQRQREVEQMRSAGHLRAEREDVHYREKVEKLISGLLNLNKEAQEVQRELTHLSMQYKRALNEKNEYEIELIQKNYRRLRMVKEKHKAKEKRVLEAAQTDSCVREAVAEFQRRRKVMSRQQHMPQHLASQNDQQARQLLRLRQHEMEKQRQIHKMRAQQQEQRILQLQQQQRMNSRMNLYRGEHHSGALNMNNSSPPFDSMQPNQGRLFASEATVGQSNDFISPTEDRSQHEFARRSQPLQQASETDYFGGFSAMANPQNQKEESFGFDFSELNIASATQKEEPASGFAFAESAFETSNSVNASNGLLNNSSFDFTTENGEQ